MSNSEPRTEGEWREWLAPLPKTETHLHFEGSIPYRVLQALDPEDFYDPPPFWRDDYRFATFPEFEGSLIGMAMRCIKTADDYATVAKALFEDLKAEGVVYVETSFHAGLVDFVPQLQPEEVIAAIRSGVPEGLEVRIFAGMARTEPGPALKAVQQRLPKMAGLAGIDIHGVETIPLLPWADELWKRCGEEGLELKAHAGEYGGPEAVAEVLDRLKVKRVQHGIASAEDPALMDRLAAEGVVLDVCPISNLKLGRVPSMAEHPIRKLLNHGIRCTVSTDDPMIFGNTITQEYAWLATKTGCSKEEILTLLRHGFLAGSPSPELRERALKALV